MSEQATFRPTRAELNRVRFLATECEIHARAHARLSAAGHPNDYGHVAARYSRDAFALSAAVARRALVRACAHAAMEQGAQAGAA